MAHELRCSNRTRPLRSAREPDLRSRRCSVTGVARACQGSRKVKARTIIKRTTWYPALMMKMKAGREAGRRRDAQRRNQIPRGGSSSTFHLHRRMIARYGSSWRDLWQTGLRNQQRRLGCHFLMLSTKPGLLPRPKNPRDSFAFGA